MNAQRILRITNSFLVFTGFQLHTFDPVSERFHVSLWALVNFIVLTLFFIICVNQHFSQSPLLNFVHDVSPFFWQLLRFHLMLVMKVYAFRLFTMSAIGRSCNCIGNICSRLYLRKFTMEEAFVYVLIFSTFLISLCFALYIAYEMEFQLPPWDTIFISFGLFIPHFALAGAIKLYTLSCWLMRKELQQGKCELEDVLMEQLSADVVELKVDVNMTQARANLTEINVLEVLEQQRKRFVQLVENLKLVSATLGKEIALLLLVNSSCLLAGVYTLVYFRTNWHIFFSAPSKRIFYASNIAIYVLIFWDYLCLCTSISLFNKVKSQTLQTIQLVLKAKQAKEKSTYAALKEIRYILSSELRVSLLNIADIDAVNLIMFHIVLGIIISVLVIYQYLNDQIVYLNSQLDMDVD